MPTFLLYTSPWLVDLRGEVFFFHERMRDDARKPAKPTAVVLR